MPAYTYPGVYIEEVPSGVRTIAGVATSIGLFIGWAPKGATDRAVRLTNFSDYEREFGGLDQRSLLGYSVKQFFDNGGTDTYVVRLVANDADTAQASIGTTLTFTATSPGAWANRHQIRSTRRPAPDADRFRIDVLDEDDTVVETFENLSLTGGDARFPSNVINGRSRIVTIEATAGVAPTDSTVDLDNSTTGTDGTVLEPDSSDFNSALTDVIGIGSLTDHIDIYNIVCVPGLTDAATVQALQTECRRRRAFLIVDADPSLDIGDMAGNGTAGITGSVAPNSAIYYPWVQAPDPRQQGALRDFPPCGYVAGVYARTDATRGVWKAPAGSDASLNGALGLQVTMSDPENGQLNPIGINCLRTLPIYGNVVWGARTLHGQNDRGSEWKYVPVRRMALFLEESLYRGTQWVVFEPNDEPLWAQIRLNVGAFMQNLFRQGAFQGQTPRDAYFVRCDRTTTTQNDIDLGIVNILVGFAPLKPAEFVVIKIQQIAGEIAT